MVVKTQRVLLVEDDPLFARALMRMLKAIGLDVTHVGTLADGLDALAQRWDAVILDVRLPDGSGVKLVEVAVQKRPIPLLIAISGQANRRDTFELGKWGVARFLEKPISMMDLMEALQPDAEASSRALELHAAQTVGHAKVQDVTSQVRNAMFEQALAMADGNVKAAGELLGVSRQAVERQSHQARPVVKTVEPGPRRMVHVPSAVWM